MPSSSEKQRRFMGMKLGEQERTGHNSTGMSAGQLKDFARKPVRPSGKRSKSRR